MELNLEALMTQFTTQEQVKEANQIKTLPSGTYVLRVTKITPETADEKAPIPGRQQARYQATAHDPLTGDRKGILFFNVSWEVHRKADKNGVLILDGPSKLWGQLVKALDADKKSVGETLQASGNYPFMARVGESFSAGENTPLINYETPEERVKLLNDGSLKPINFVQSIFPVRK